MSPAITPAAATAVVDGYELRARFARADADAVSRPRLLRGLLCTARHVAEVPCGAGHFLADYATAGVKTTLIDGNGAMLAAAIAHAADIGLPSGRTHAHVEYVQELGELAGVDLVVIPNAALNQLTCQTPLTELLAAVHHVLRPGAELLAQVACTHPGGGIDTAGCYDPIRQRTWADLGSGSESMLWAIGLRAQRLVAVDADPQRLAMLRKFTSEARPRGAHRTALALCGRTDPHDFSLRCRSLTATVAVDCLTGHPPCDPSLPPAGVELVTQFGLLGLCRDAEHFADRFTAAHQLVTPGGWAADANWVARNRHQRVELTERLYQSAAARAGIELLLTRRVPITADPDFTAVWTYIGRKHRHGHRGARHAVSDTHRAIAPG